MVAVITKLGVPVEEELVDIGMMDRKVAINMEYDDEAYGIRSLRSVRKT